MLRTNVVLPVLVFLMAHPVALHSGSEDAVVASGDVTVDWAEQKTPTIRMFLSPPPADYRRIIDDKKQLLRARIKLDASTVLDFREAPKGIDFYDSSIVVDRQGVVRRTYRIGKLTKHQALSLAHVGIVRAGNGTGMLICEYEGGSVGAREGFAILRFSPKGLSLQTLPLTDFGKVVIFRDKPDQVEIWSALAEGAGADAEPMLYSTRDCRWKPTRYVCGPPRRKTGRFSPTEIFDPGIEIR